MELNYFDNWNKLKQKVHNSEIKEFYVNPKEIWYIHKWINIWFESNWKWEDFKRPVLVLKKLWSLFFVISMTTKWKNNRYYFKLSNTYFEKDSYITLSQVFVVDKKRFFEYIWEISWSDFWKVKKELKNILF